VASDQYEQEGLHNLVAPAADAEALAGVLGDPQSGLEPGHGRCPAEGLDRSAPPGRPLS
jgi:hypothetical protein